MPENPSKNKPVAFTVVPWQLYMLLAMGFLTLAILGITSSCSWQQPAVPVVYAASPEILALHIKRYEEERANVGASAVIPQGWCAVAIVIGFGGTVVSLAAAVCAAEAGSPGTHRGEGIG